MVNGIVPRGLRDLGVPWWEDIVAFPRPALVRILVVVDGSVGASSTHPSAFGVGRVLEILRKRPPYDDAEFGYVRFEVETATRDADALDAVDRRGFRFDEQVNGQPVLDKFDQVWLFGFHPGNTGSTVDVSIESHSTKVTDSELRALATWMKERRGGVLAMGDHHFLGATMAWKVPRVRAMRRWTNADHVPPIDEPITSADGVRRERHDTNQPQNALQATPGANATIPRDAEEDGIPQKLEVKRYTRGNYWLRIKQPHPILCDREYGTIDVFPDHPHEGWVYEDHEVKLDATYDFGEGVTGPDFPPAADGGAQPRPEAIAWAKPWTEDPYEHAKSPTSVSRFAVLGAYDGHRANVGRVVVDSTWHHWFNMNISGIEAAAAGGTPQQVKDWHKIRTYFRNVAVWLSPPAKQATMLRYATFWSTGLSVAMEEYRPNVKPWIIGQAAREILGKTVSHCMLTSWIRPLIPERFLERQIVPPPEPCLSCPPITFVEDTILGALIQELLPERDRLIQAKLDGKRPELDLKRVNAALIEGPARGLAAVREMMAASMKRGEDLLSALDETKRPPIAALPDDADGHDCR